MPNRRDALRLAAAAAALPALSAPGLARAPLAGGPTPPAFRVKVGAFEVTAVADGTLEIERALLPGAEAAPADADALLDRAFRPRGAAVRAMVNAFVVNGPERTVLIDAGTAPGFAPTLGRLPQNLRAAGVEPAQVDLVLLTHLHPDHAGGLLDAAGAPVYPNAEILVRAAEHAFWHDDAAMNRAGEGARPFFEGARKALAPYAARTRRFDADGEVAPGIAAVHLPGHTPGHTGFRVGTGADALLVFGDLIHVPAWQFARPDWSVAFDTDPAQAAATRRRVLDMAAGERLRVAGMHLDLPAIGRVARAGAGAGAGSDGFAFVAESWAPF